jgi:hypothetical protein
MHLQCIVGRTSPRLKGRFQPLLANKTNQDSLFNNRLEGLPIVRSQKTVRPRIMVHAINVRNMLQRMGLSVEAATEVVNVNGQNLSVLDDFLQLEDKDVETLCRVIRRPGGVNAAGNQNQGMQVSSMAEANLKRMCYELRHHTRVSRPVVWADITLLSVRALSAQAEMETSH